MEEGTPKAGETSTPEAPKNGTQTPAPNTGNASDPAVEQLRKEKEQAEMRARQLANELAAKKKAEEEAEAKRLAEQNEYKTLHEQEKAKREALEAKLAEEERRKELAKAKAEVLADYSDDVKAAAEDLGLDLSDTDDDAKATFKEKLDKLQQRVGVSGKVTPNNPGKPSAAPELSGPQLATAMKSQDKFEEIISKKPGIAAMMSPKR